VSAEVALRAKNDQLLSGVRDALRLASVKGLGVLCPACGAKVGRSCYGNGPMAVPHEGRTALAQEELKKILLNCLDMEVKS
jgi:hypothetical protein